MARGKRTRKNDSTLNESENEHLLSANDSQEEGEVGPQEVHVVNDEAEQSGQEEVPPTTDAEDYMTAPEHGGVTDSEALAEDTTGEMVDITVVHIGEQGTPPAEGGARVKPEPPSREASTARSEPPVRPPPPVGPPPPAGPPPVNGTFSLTHRVNQMENFQANFQTEIRQRLEGQATGQE